MNDKLSKIESLCTQIEVSIQGLTNRLRDTNVNLSVVISNSTKNSNRIESSEHRINRIDIRTKVYVDTKVKALKTHLGIESIMKDVGILKRKKHCKEAAIEWIGNVVVNVLLCQHPLLRPLLLLASAGITKNMERKL